MFSIVRFFLLFHYLRVAAAEENLDWRSDLVNVTCFPLFAIAAALERKDVDYLSLDLGRRELDILKTLPPKFVAQVILFSLAYK